MNLLSQIEDIANAAASQSQRQPEFLANTIGCIVDITQPLYRQKQNNYIVEVKLIDQTFNQLAQTNYLIKYLSVILISDKIDDLKLTSKIGDLIYLHKFMFSAWNQIKIKAKFYGSFQCLYQVHSGELQEDQTFKLQKKLGKDTNFNVDAISIRIAELKNWLRINFKDIFKPFIGVKIINNYCSLIEPFSIILKVKSIFKNQFENYLFLVDANRNNFYLDLKPYINILFMENSWVYLRGIKFVHTDKQITFIDTGRVIQLPHMFNEQYESISNYKAIYRKTNRLGSQKKQTSALTYITLFDQKVSTVKQLFDLQDQYKATSKKQDIILQNNYLVKGAVIKYTGVIKLYHLQYQMIVHEKYLQQITSQQKKSTIQEKKLVYLFQGTLSIVDRSINSKKQCLKIILFTNDSTSTFFDQKQLEKLSNFIGHSDIEKKKDETLKYINSKLEKLRQLSSFQSPAALVLEPIRSDKLIFRLINTKIA